VVSSFGKEILLPSGKGALCSHARWVRHAQCHRGTRGKNVATAAGEVDRERLGRLVFSSKALRQCLNRATHLPLALCILWELLWHWLTLHTLVVRAVAQQ
jgi:hypothetical protein